MKTLLLGAAVLGAGAMALAGKRVPESYGYKVMVDSKSTGAHKAPSDAVKINSFPLTYITREKPRAGGGVVVEPLDQVAYDSLLLNLAVSA